VAADASPKPPHDAGTLSLDAGGDSRLEESGALDSGGASPEVGPGPVSGGDEGDDGGDQGDPGQGKGGSK
jgi:hypothetical protein